MKKTSKDEFFVGFMAGGLISGLISAILVCAFLILM